MKNINKLYIAYKAGYLGDNILTSYFSFFANMISQEKITVIEDGAIAKKFLEWYSLELPLPFVRQVLGVGVKNNCFVEDHGKYSVVVEELEKYQFNETDFTIMWDQLIQAFSSYCKEDEIDLPADVAEFILSELDKTDDKILSGEKVELSGEKTDEGHEMSAAEFAWYSFIKLQGEKNSALFSFVSALSASNITKQALFYFGDETPDYSGLNVYLDSPIIFALLGMDEESRTQSYKTLIKDMQNANCSIHVLDHIFQEVDGIITRAASWATNTQYDLRKANKAARFFHDSRMSESDISEFCADLETKLNDLGITIIETHYDIYQDDFQEDETCLFDMVKSKYLENGYELLHEKEESIRVDVRSIIMIYRKREGQTATKLQNAKHIMLTSNNAIANVSKKYESSKSLQSGHVPACISADLFGAILWLNSPMQLQEYQRKKLLADCYAYLKPDRKLLDKYIQSLDEARKADAIDEKKYLFLRTHPVVLDSLMDITRGDYARFNSNTYLEVYEDIQAKSQKQYKKEAEAHEQTRLQLQQLEEQSANDKQEASRREDERTREIASLKEKIASMEQKEKERQNKDLEKKVNTWGWLFTVICIGVPCLILLVLIEIVKSLFTGISWCSVLVITGAIIAAVIVELLVWNKGKQFVFQKVRTHFEKKQ